jgi:uncharacterized protein (TIGR02246 family)
MRTIWLPLALLWFALTPAAAQDKSDPNKEHPAHQELRAMRDALIEVVNKHDLDRLLTFLDDDVVVTWQNGEVSRGPKEVRAYYERMMQGPNRVVESVTIAPHVDTLTHLYGDNAGVAHGSSKDHFKLTDGRDLDLDTRWSATVVKKDGQWKIASFHASTNMFDNPVLWIAVRRSMWWIGIAAVLAGLLLGFIAARLLRRRVASA